MKAALIADIVLALALLASLIIGGKRGLMYSLAGLVIVVVALFGASYAANRFSPAVADWLAPKIQSKIEQRVENTMGTASVGENSTDRTADIGELLKRLNVDTEKIVSDAKEKVADTAVSLTVAAIQSVIDSIAYALTYLLAFLILFVVLKLLIKPLHLATKIPGFHAIDVLGGAVLGFAGGALLAFLLVWLLLKFNWILTDDMVENSTLLKFFAENSPVSVIASL